MRVIIVGCCALLLAGCEPPGYSFGRTADIPSVPDPGQVLAILRRVPGIDSATFLGVDPHSASPDVVYNFRYTGRNGARAMLQFRQMRAGAQLDQYYFEVGNRPPQALIDSTMPIMRAVEARLEAEAGLTGLRAAVVQRCEAVRC